jgi:cbb3-type cytochrome c oxidase subunit III
MTSLRSFEQAMKKIITLSFSSIALAGFLAAAWPGTETNMVMAAADAAATYKTKCSGCHGADGKGVESMGTPNMTDPKWQAGHSTAVITNVINHGKGQMPGFKSSMNAAEVKAMVAYIRGLAPKAPAKKK